MGQSDSYGVPGIARPILEGAANIAQSFVDSAKNLGRSDKGRVLGAALMAGLPAATVVSTVYSTTPATAQELTQVAMTSKYKIPIYQPITEVAAKVQSRVDQSAILRVHENYPEGDLSDLKGFLEDNHVKVYVHRASAREVGDGGLQFTYKGAGVPEPYYAGEAAKILLIIQQIDKALEERAKAALDTPKGEQPG